MSGTAISNWALHGWLAWVAWKVICYLIQYTLYIETNHRVFKPIGTQYNLIDKESNYVPIGWYFLIQIQIAAVFLSVYGVLNRG